MSEMQVPGNIPEETIGDRLRRSLKHSKVTVQDMAVHLEVSRNTVGNYINDHVRIPGGYLKLWAMRTGVPIEWLRTGEGETPHQPEGGGESGGTCGYLARPVSLAA
jgi:transcriptional regulator with XRE-family HTH domain